MQVAEFDEPSVAVTFTTVRPNGKILPEVLLKVILGINPLLSVALAVKLTTL